MGSTESVNIFGTESLTNFKNVGVSFDKHFERFLKIIKDSWSLLKKVAIKTKYFVNF